MPESLPFGGAPVHDILDKAAFRTKIRELMGLFERETYVEFLTWYEAKQYRSSSMSVGEIVDIYLEEKHATR